jgi:hypothetical protein
MGECLAGFLASRSPNVTEQSGRLNRVKTVFVFGIEQSTLGFHFGSISNGGVFAGTAKLPLNPSHRRPQLKGETKEHWMELCRQAAVEQNPERLMELIHAINRILDEKEQRLRREHASTGGI